MKKLVISVACIILFTLICIPQAFALTGDVTMEGLLQISKSAPRFLLTDTDTPFLSLGLASEVGGQLIDYGANYSQMGLVNAAYPGGFFRIDLRSDHTYEFFNVKFVPAGGAEQTIYYVSRAGDMTMTGSMAATGFKGNGTPFRVYDNTDSTKAVTIDVSVVPTGQTRNWAVGTGVPSSIEVFSTNGTFTWTKPAYISKVYVQVWGGGGGGRTGANNQSGGGGGGGGYSAGLVSVTGNVTVVVGQGGATGNPASAGTASSFEAASPIRAAGGSAGTTTGGTGGAGTGGTINISGSTGGNGLNVDASGGGCGGGSPLGGAGGSGGVGSGTGAGGVGAPGTQPGGGGGGGGEAVTAGAAGANGLVIIMY